ncbi:hypothetical protein NUW58_g10510 [Xylaria curta]|uniref:Uncharacterized protein n=1 Tax=Xylaria curta TaxID=42375 RepID=A0ACC1MKD3_9PEZI|nr:hypothetical protein NUW58_g10510 [Xylaria curta]
MAALKKIILDHDASFGDIVAPAELKSEDGLFDEDAVRVWVENNWERVLEVAWAINQERYRKSQERKGTSKRTVSGSEKSVDGGLRAKEKTQT